MQRTGKVHLYWPLVLIRRLLKEEDGGSMALFAAVMIPLLGFIGLAVDAGRGYAVKARLSDSLDAAVLASAHEVSSPSFEPDIQMYFNANFPPGYLGATVILAPPIVDTTKDTITLTATATIDTTFMRLFGFDQLTVASATEVTRQTVSMDVVLSMDMSGSMSWSDGAGSSRIAAARRASHTMIDILYGSETTKQHLKMALVPWNGKVNITENGLGYLPGAVTTMPTAAFVNPYTGSSQSDIYLPDITPVPLLDVPTNGWRGCVFARYLPAAAANAADHLLGSASVGGTDWPAWRYIPGNANCLSHGVTRLSINRADIESAVDQLTNPKGTTNIAQGLVWAWRVVTPGEPFDDADPFPTGDHKRAIVLMTDGEQTGTGGDGYNAAFGNGASAGANGMDDRLRAVASNIKSQGVLIYTIQFYHDTGPLRALMQDVATEPAAPYYHFAPDGAALEQVFEEIANDLSELRVSR